MKTSPPGLLRNELPAYTVSSLLVAPTFPQKGQRTKGLWALGSTQPSRWLQLLPLPCSCSKSKIIQSTARCCPQHKVTHRSLCPHDPYLPPAHTLLHLSPRPGLETPFFCLLVCFFFLMEPVIWRDSKLQMIFYPFFFLLARWIFFYPRGVTEQSTLAQSQMTYFPGQNQMFY